MHTANNPELCPVNLWASTIYHLHYYPRFDPRWPVSTLFDEKNPNITSLDVRNNIHCAVRDIGKDKLGFTEDDVGTHSNRSIASMAVYLANVPVFKIIIIGCWYSGSFLIYICRKITSFT